MWHYYHTGEILVRSRLMIDPILELMLHKTASHSVRTRHGGCGKHGHGLRELNCDFLLHVHQLPHALLLRVVWLRGISCGWANTLILHLQEIITREVLLRRITPVITAPYPVVSQQIAEAKPTGRNAVALRLHMAFRVSNA